MKAFFVLFAAFFLTFSVAAQTGSKSFVKMVYWDEDKNKCPVCDSKIIEGTKFFIFKTPEIELAFSGNFYKELFWASVFLINRSESPFELKPSRSVIAVYKKTRDKIPVEVYPITSEQAAEKSKDNAGLKKNIAVMSANLAAQTLRINLAKTGETFLIGLDENSARVSNKETTGTIISPNKQSQNVARRKAEENRASRKSGKQITDAELKPETLYSQKAIGGNIYFPFTKGESMYIGIRIGNTLYVKSFSGVK